MLQAEYQANLGSREIFRLDEGQDAKLCWHGKSIGNGPGRQRNEIRRRTQIHLRGFGEKMSRIRFRQKPVVLGRRRQHNNGEG